VGWLVTRINTTTRIVTPILIRIVTGATMTTRAKLRSARF
jgi:hypothetical protein